MTDLNKDNILDTIVECGKVLDRLRKEEEARRICPECNHYPTDMWAVWEGPMFRSCSKCSWTDMPDSIRWADYPGLTDDRTRRKPSGRSNNRLR